MSTCPAMTAAADSNAKWLARTHSLRAAVLPLLCNVWTLLMCKGVIGCASAFDTYLTLKYAASLPVYEQNPIGRWLMGLDAGPEADTQQIAAFITAKFVGTVIVLLTIQGLAFWRLRLAGLVAVPVAAFQLLLVLHLVFVRG